MGKYTIDIQFNKINQMVNFVCEKLHFTSFPDYFLKSLRENQVFRSWKWGWCSGERRLPCTITRAAPLQSVNRASRDALLYGGIKKAASIPEAAQVRCLIN